jgi:hypothetical protein
VKTTIEVSDDLLARAKELAAARSTTLRQVFEEGLTAVIDSSSRKAPRYRMRDLSVGAGGKAPHKSWEEIREMIYEARGA